MQLLYSNILPLNVEHGQEIFVDHFKSAMTKADRVDIAVGYISKSSVNELDILVQENNIKEVNLIIGMYYLEGMPEGTYNTACMVAEKWERDNIGIIKMVRAMKYHGKLYAFYKNGKAFEAFIGSHNLGAIKSEASNIRQYEISATTTEEKEIQEITTFIDRLSSDKCSRKLLDINDMNIIYGTNNALVGQEYVSKITVDEVEAYKNKVTDISFEIPLKVPVNDKDENMRGSNINVCYARGRKRVWWEIEIVVAKAIRDLPNYPEYQKPFMAVTDDGWKFLAWTCGQNNKNLYSKDDLKIMGRWIKGRLVAAGLVEPVNDVSKDIESKGVITEEMLERYGRNTVTLQKTELKTMLDDGTEVPVWLLSFLPKSLERGDE